MDWTGGESGPVSSIGRVLGHGKLNGPELEEITPPSLREGPPSGRSPQNHCSPKEACSNDPEPPSGGGRTGNKNPLTKAAFWTSENSKASWM